MIDIKDARNYVRARVRELERLKGLDAVLTEISNAQKLLAELQRQTEEEKAGHAAMQKEAEERAAAIVAEAEQRAERLGKDADGIWQKAAGFEKDAADALERAKAEAADIAAAGRQRGIDEYEAKKAELNTLQIQVTDAQQTRDALAAEVTDLESRKGKIEQQIAKLKSM